MGDSINTPELRDRFIKAFRDCCDCRYAGGVQRTCEYSSDRCDKCFDDPARPDWEQRKVAIPTSTFAEREYKRTVSELLLRIISYLKSDCYRCRTEPREHTLDCSRCTLRKLITDAEAI